jgi:hypothetical protein
MGREHADRGHTPDHLFSEPLRRYLSDLVAEQKEEVEEIRLRTTDIETLDALSVLFCDSTRLGQMYIEAVRFFLEPRTVKERTKIKKEFVGQVFQTMAYRYFTLSQTNGELLSPERSFLFYKAFQQTTGKGAEVIEHPFGLDSLKGVSVPDGLVVENSRGLLRFVGWCEYTLSRKDSVLERKVEVLDIHRFRIVGSSDNLPLTFITPEMKQIPEILLRPDIRHITMPFSHREFFVFCNGIFDTYQPEISGITLPTISQAERFNKRARELDMFPAVRDYS